MTVVIASAIVPTMIAQAFFKPRIEPLRVDGGATRTSAASDTEGDGALPKESSPASKPQMEP